MTNREHCREEIPTDALGVSPNDVLGGEPVNDNDRVDGPPRGRGRHAGAARRRALAARRRRGLTLVEVLLVVSLIGLIGAAIVAPIFTQGEKAKEGVARTAARQMHASAEQWLATHNEGDCPTPERLVEDGVVSETATLNDPWGKPFRIVCEATRVRVISWGPDRKENTADDVRVPAARVASGGT